MNQPTKGDNLALRPIQRELGEPLFKEPWEAQAFAIAFRLVENGLVTRGEWANALGCAIKVAQAEGDLDEGDTYYYHVLAAIESLTSEKGLVSLRELKIRKQEWSDAYLSTPHGKPVEL